MLRISRLVLAIICLSGALGAQAQKESVNLYPDTLIVSTDSKNTLVLAFKNLLEEKPDLNNELWKSILGIMESSLQTATNDQGVKVTYEKVVINNEERAKIEVAEIEKESDIFWIGKDGMDHNTSDRVEFVVIQPKVKITFSLNDIEQLEEIKEINVESIWKSDMQKANTKRVMYNGNGSIELGLFRIDEISHTNPRDFLELSAGVGIGFYQDRFVPDVSYDLSFNFSDRYGKPRTRIGLLYTQHYVLNEKSEGGFDLKLNGFLNAYWAISKGSNKEYGIGFGYLINQNGGFYKGDTFKLSVYNRKTSKTSLTPEFVFTDGFKKAFPALRFGLSF